MTTTRGVSRPALALLISAPDGRRVAVTRQGDGFAAVAEAFDGLVCGPDLRAVIAAAALDVPEAGWIEEVAQRVERELAAHEERS
jgi:hypothetical protein